MGHAKNIANLNLLNSNFMALGIIYFPSTTPSERKPILSAVSDNVNKLLPSLVVSDNVRNV